MLTARWKLRMQSTASGTRFDSADAEASLAEIETALDHLARLQSAAGISDQEWGTRRQMLERELVRPVRAWRSVQSERQALVRAVQQRSAKSRGDDAEEDEAAELGAEAAAAAVSEGVISATAQAVTGPGTTVEGSQASLAEPGAPDRLEIDQSAVMPIDSARK
jgi:hypothetical protein